MKGSLDPSDEDAPLECPPEVARALADVGFNLEACKDGYFKFNAYYSAGLLGAPPAETAAWKATSLSRAIDAIVDHRRANGIPILGAYFPLAAPKDASRLVRWLQARTMGDAILYLRDTFGGGVVEEWKQWEEERLFDFVDTGPDYYSRALLNPD